MPTPGIFRLWLDRRIDSNQLAEVEEYTDKLKELVEGVCAAAFVLAIRLLHRIAFGEVLSAASQRGRGF